MVQNSNKTKKLDPLQHMKKERDEVPKFYALEYGDNNNQKKRFTSLQNY